MHTLKLPSDGEHNISNVSLEGRITWPASSAYFSPDHCRWGAEDQQWCYDSNHWLERYCSKMLCCNGLWWNISGWFGLKYLTGITENLPVTFKLSVYLWDPRNCKPEIFRTLLICIWFGVAIRDHFLWYVLLVPIRLYFTPSQARTFLTWRSDQYHHCRDCGGWRINSLGDVDSFLTFFRGKRRKFLKHSIFFVGIRPLRFSWNQSLADIEVWGVIDLWCVTSVQIQRRDWSKNCLSLSNLHVFFLISTYIYV